MQLPITNRVNVDLSMAETQYWPFDSANTIRNDDVGDDALDAGAGVGLDAVAPVAGAIKSNAIANVAASPTRLTLILVIFVFMVSSGTRISKPPPRR
jgi:hypothetical protein